MKTEYNSLEWFYVTGRGWIAIVYFRGEGEHWNPGEYVGKTVTVDGYTFKVRSVDMYRHMFYEEYPYNGTIGLLE